MESSRPLTDLQKLIEGNTAGDAAMHEALITHSCRRILKLTRKMFHQYPDLKRWEQTDDVHQKREYIDALVQFEEAKMEPT